MRKIRIVSILIIATLFLVLVPAIARIYQEPVFKRATEKTATLFFAPETAKGGNLILKLMIDPGKQAVNAIGTIISFPKDLLTVDSIDETDSTCEFFMDKDFDNDLGTIRFSCGSPSPGIENKSSVAKIIFKKKKNGWATIGFDENTMALANDGYSTNILKLLRNQRIYITK